MNVDINLERELNAVRNLNDEIRKCLRRYIKNPNYIHRYIVDNKIDEIDSMEEIDSITQLIIE